MESFKFKNDKFLISYQNTLQINIQKKSTDFSIISTASGPEGKSTQVGRNELLLEAKIAKLQRRILFSFKTEEIARTKSLQMR